MRAVTLGIVAASLLIGVAGAQTTTSSAPSQPADHNSSTGTNTGVLGRLTNTGDRAAASGDNNQIVATTSANAAQPAKGSNSFSEEQARGRLKDNGFADVSGLKKDDNGIWRGQANKNGQNVAVWLDYKGNAGSN